MSDHHLELVEGLPAAAGAGMPPTNIANTIEQLPMASPVQAAAGLARALDVLLQPRACSAAEREKCLQLARKPLQALVGGVRSQIVVESHPLPPAKAEMAAAVLALCGRYGDACCLAVYEATAPSGKVSLFARGRIAGLLSQAVDSLAQALLLAYQLYQSPPAGLWQRLHAAYAFAAERGLDSRDADIDGYRATLRQRYAAALLLAMSNPYAFQRNELLQVVDACRALAPHASLLDNLGGTAAVASGAGDSGPGYLPQERGKPEHGALSLDLEPVIDLVRDQIAWTPPEVDMVELRQRRGGGIAVPRHLLDRLVKAWRGSVERDHRRMNAQHTLDTVLGLHVLHQALAGGQGFESFQRQLSGREIELGSQDAAAWIGSAGSDAFAVTSVRVLDQSLGGYRMLWPAQQRLRVRIGELVGLATPAATDDEAADAAVASPWLIGIVRWLRSEGNGDLHVGVELLARQARPAAIRGIDAHGVRGPVQRALLLDGESGDEELLLPSVGNRQFEGVELGSPADHRRSRPALRSVARGIVAIEALGTAYYRVSLSDPAEVAD